MTAAAIAACLATAPAGAALDASNPHAVSGRLLVRFEPGTDGALRAALHRAAGGRVVRRIAAIGYEEIAAPAGALDIYRRARVVSVAEPVVRGTIALSPPDACLTTCDGVASQWQLAMVNAPAGWSVFPGRTYTASSKPAGITIAVLDTKIDGTHPDWVNAGGSSADAAHGGQLDLANARDWVPASHQTGSAAYHGTFVAGLAGAAAGNGRGVAGVGYAARVLPLTVVDGSGHTDSAVLADAIVYAWKRGARVINLSLGILADSAAVRDAIRLVTTGTSQRAPSLVVAAAGNNTGDAPFYPGSYPEVMSVAGTDAHDRPAPCSNHNANVSVSAPADRLVGLAPMPTEALRAPCGTSAAAPQVSGLAALLFMQDPSRTPDQVRAIIERSADDLGPSGRDDRFGHGRINIERALRASGPRVRSVSATVVANGRSTVIATATPGVTRAQIVFGRPDATPVEMRVSGTSLSVELPVPGGTAGGPHPIWIRAQDGTAWGAAATGVVAVDARAPTIAGLATTASARAAGEPFAVTFTATDDYATTVTFGIEVRATATGQVVHRDARFDVPAGPQRLTWTPPLTAAPGHYTVKVAVADPSGNVAHAEAGGFVA